MTTWKWVAFVGLVASLVTIGSFVTGIFSIPDLLGFRRGVPLESRRLIALIESCKYEPQKCSRGNGEPILRAGANPNIPTDAGIPALQLALIYNLSPDTIKLLIDNGADVNRVTPRGDTPLTQIAGSYGPNTLQYTQILVGAGCEVNAANKDGWTALMFAAYGTQDSRFIQALLKVGGRADLKNKEGKTALDIAVQQFNNEERSGYP